jgi:hypothetical protein
MQYYLASWVPDIGRVLPSASLLCIVDDIPRASRIQLAVYYEHYIKFWLSYVILRGIANCSVLGLFMSKFNNSIHDDPKLIRFGSTFTFIELICHKT